MTDPQLPDIAHVRKMLQWTVFLAACSLLILLVDMQLKRSIGRQAVAVSREFADLAARAKGAARGPGPADSGTDRLGPDAGGPAVDGDASLAAGTPDESSPAVGLQDPAPAGPRIRPPGNGRRTSRPDSGS